MGSLSLVPGFPTQPRSACEGVGQEEMRSCILKPLMPCPSSLRFGREFCGREPLPSSTGKVCDSGLEGS